MKKNLIKWFVVIVTKSIKKIIKKEKSLSILYISV